ncbi:MAG: hypothetical protein WCE21_05325 [Candidatus Babeliales bacterium]
MRTVIKILYVALNITPLVFASFDNPHFYRAAYLWPEPRIEQDWLTTFDCSFGSGTTTKGYNSDGKKVSLLDIFGTQNMIAFGKNAPDLEPENELDALLIALSKLPADNEFAHLAFTGNFHIVEFMLHYYQNLIHGFFLHFHLPIRILRIDEIGYKDLSPLAGPFTAYNSTWQELLKNLKAIFNRHDIHINSTMNAGVGDLTMLAGWTWNYQGTTVWDYVDITGQWGFLAPTGKRKNIDNPFELPLGYNGYWGVPVSFDLSAGILEWITMGFHVGALFLLNRTSTERIQTAPDQTGFIKLTKAKVCIDPGTVWQASVYAKADHIARGFSFILGYSFNTRDRSIIEGSSFIPLTLRKLNKDPQLGHWRIHTIHVNFEYDFSCMRTDKLPHVGLWCNITTGGMRIFDTLMTAPYLGIDLSWCF